MTSVALQRSQNCDKRIQKKRSSFRSFGRRCRRFRTASCCLSARFSSARSERSRRVVEIRESSRRIVRIMVGKSQAPRHGKSTVSMRPEFWQRTATDVIDLATFLNAPNKTGYDDAVCAKPFKKSVDPLPEGEACATTAKARTQAFSLIRRSVGAPLVHHVCFSVGSTVRSRILGHSKTGEHVRRPHFLAHPPHSLSNLRIG